MKKIIGLLTLFFFIAQTVVHAQVAINTDASNPDNSAMLDIKSTLRGFLMPRMTSTQRTAIGSPADGLMVYDVTTKSLWVFQSGTGWLNSFLGSGSFSVPDSIVASSPATLLSLTNGGTGAAFQAIGTNSANMTNLVNVLSNTSGSIAPRSLGNASNFFVNNTTAVSAAVRGEVNSIFGNEGTAGVYGVSSGTGGYGGFFEHTNPTGFGIALYTSSAGLGTGSYFETTNTGNTQPTAQIIQDGTGKGLDVVATNSSTIANILNVTTTGPGVIADHSQGNAGNFFVNNTTAVAAGVRGEVNSIFGNNATAGIYGVASGTGGYCGWFEHSNPTGFGLALEAVTSGQGVVAHFETEPTTNGQPTVQMRTNGTGSGLTVDNTNGSNVSNIVNVTTNGPGVIADHSQGNAGNFFVNNTTAVAAGVRGEVNSIFGNNATAGVYGVASGTGGYGGWFEHSNASGFGLALEAVTSGQGVVAHFETLPSSNGQPTVQMVTNGTGSGLTVDNTNGSNVANIVNVTSNGPGVIADHSQGNAGNFFVNNTTAVAAGVRGEVNSIFGNAGTAGVYGVASGTGGYAGYFEHSETTGFGTTLQVVGYDQGTAMVVDQEGPNNIAIFQASGFDMARIDNTGRGFFNGGTQNSGADLAEAFDVEGDYHTYEPGDVLLISTTADRTVVKSNEAYSSLVAGVYATKPGVLLTEESITSTLAGKVPMGVVGVIPTKVCGDSGPIHRGDILVTSARPGYAMKADLNKLKPGQAIGKALEEFSGDNGKIKVLVNVK